MRFSGGIAKLMDARMADLVPAAESWRPRETQERWGHSEVRLPAASGSSGNS